jgi:hypothetical protein
LILSRDARKGNSININKMKESGAAYHTQIISDQSDRKSSSSTSVEFIFILLFFMAYPMHYSDAYFGFCVGACSLELGRPVTEGEICDLPADQNPENLEDVE